MDSRFAILPHDKDKLELFNTASLEISILLQYESRYSDARLISRVSSNQGCNPFALWGKTTPTTNLEPAILEVGCELELVLKCGFRGNQNI